MGKQLCGIPAKIQRATYLRKQGAKLDISCKKKSNRRKRHQSRILMQQAVPKAVFEQPRWPQVTVDNRSSRRNPQVTAASRQQSGRPQSHQYKRSAPIPHPSKEARRIESAFATYACLARCWNCPNNDYPPYRTSFFCHFT